MNSIGGTEHGSEFSTLTAAASVSDTHLVSWKVVRRLVRHLLPMAVVAYFLPWAFAFYLLCGAADVLRNRPFSRDTIHRYFLGNGLVTWLLSPLNLFFDLLALPYRNKGIYELEDLPVAYRDEIRALVAAATQPHVIQALESRIADCDRGMTFFKWYGRYMPASIDVPEFQAKYKFVRTVGVSVFNKRKSTSFHFGPLRATLRVLYNINEVADPGAFVEVGYHVNRWCENKLFIFDDTLEHRSCNETNVVRYCLFVDILRPSLMPGVLSAVVSLLGLLLIRFRSGFYRNWRLVK